MDSEILQNNNGQEPQEETPAAQAVNDPMDYGVVYREGEEIPSPPQVAVQAIENTQVYLDTHEENLRLPYMERSFISFSYGGKYIEDFGLIRTSDGDRYNLNGYANFTDNISSNTVIDGQFYWSTHFDDNSMTLSLATDEMTERQLDDFKAWFRPGPAKELVLSEHPNRAIMARISQPPTFNFIPFEKQKKVKIGGYTKTISTTVYRGEAQIDFVSDEPYWYAKSNVLYYKDEDNNENTDYLKWLDANNILTTTFDDPDALKILYEDGLIVPEMLAAVVGISKTNDIITTQMLTGTSIVINKDMIRRSMYGLENNDDYANYGESQNDSPNDRGFYGPMFLEMEEGEGIAIARNEKGYFYYGGTAPSKPILRFALKIKFTNNTHRVKQPWNSYTYNEDDGSGTYHTITVTSKTSVTEFKFTTPNVLTSYNQAITILQESQGDEDFVTIRKKIREGVNHPIMRAAMMKALDGEEGTIDNNKKTQIIKTFQGIFGEIDDDNSGDDENNAIKFYFVFDSENARSFVKYYIYQNGERVEKVEDAGDMLRSNYLIIQDRDYLTEEGVLALPTDEHPEYAHVVTHDVPWGLHNFYLDYKYMYY